MGQIAIAMEIEGKKKEGLDEFSWIKTGQKIEKEKREKGNERNFFSTRYNESRDYYEMLIYMRSVGCKKQAK
jgi:hypothetical protein